MVLLVSGFRVNRDTLTFERRFKLLDLNLMIALVAIYPKLSLHVLDLDAFGQTVDVCCQVP